MNSSWQIACKYAHETIRIPRIVPKNEMSRGYSTFIHTCNYDEKRRGKKLIRVISIGMVSLSNHLRAD